MKISGLKTFVVGNPPPYHGGRYFIFVKLVTDDGIEGVGEVYAATFGPKTIMAMIEDVYQRHIEGADPFTIEKIWRNVYGQGYSLRPDISLCGVLSGLEMALWDIVGKAVGKPVYALLGGKAHERLRTYTYLYPKEEEAHAYQDSPVYDDPGRGGGAGAGISGAGIHGGEVRSGGAVFDLRSAPAEPRAAGAVGEILQGAARGGRDARRSSLRHARAVHDIRRDPAGAKDRGLRSAVVRGAGAARDAGGDGGGGAGDENPDRHGRAAYDEIRVRAGASDTGRLDPANEPRPRRRHPRGQKKIAGMAEAHYAQIAPHLYCGPVVGAANIQIATCSPNFLILESIGRWDGFQAKILKTGIRWEDGYVIPPEEPGLGVELDEEVALAHPYDGEGAAPRAEAGAGRRGE